MTDGAYTVAYQGVPGAFSEMAAHHWSNGTGRLLPCRTLLSVFESVAQGLAHAAVVPVENSIAGAVPGAAELIDWFRIPVIDDRTVPIRQALITIDRGCVDDLTDVWSHPVALAQCSRFLGAHRHLQPRAWFDTAGAVRDLVARRARQGAAIASAHAAAVYGAVVLQDGIEDRSDNSTRFVLVGSPVSARSPLRRRPGTARSEMAR